MLQFYLFFHLFLLFTWIINRDGLHAHEIDKRGTLIYEDLECQPIKENPDDEFPSSYNCEETLKERCLYQGQKYDVEDFIPPIIALRSCDIGCVCNEDGWFNCAHLQCPEWGGASKKSADCYHTYTLDECCNKGQRCPPFEKVATCMVDGKTYNESTQFYPKDTTLDCICKEGFSGKFVEPYCRKTVCGIKLKYRAELEQNCAPFYEDKDQRRCPSSWMCPTDGQDDNEDVTIELAETTTTIKATCKYGDKILKVGDYFKKSEKIFYLHVEEERICECLVPPLLTCYLNRSIPWD